MKNTDFLFHFPCEFPVKVMGLNNEAFKSTVISIFRKHLNTEQISSASHLSKGGKYLSITVTFVAQSRAQLDALYEELNGHDLVLMTL